MINQFYYEFLNERNYENAKELIISESSDKELFEILLECKFNHLEIMRKLIDTELKKSIDEGNWKSEFISRLLFVIYHLKLQNLSNAINEFEQVKLLKTINDCEEIAHYNLWISLYYYVQAKLEYGQDQPMSASDHIATAMKLVDKLSPYYFKHQYRYLAANIAIDLNDFNLALSYLLEIIENREIEVEFKQDVLHDIAETYRKKGDLNISLYYLCDLKQLNSDNNNLSELQSNLREIATIYLSQGDYEKAISVIEESEGYIGSKADPLDRTWLQFHRAISEYKTGQWEKASKLFGKCDRTLTKEDNPVLKSLVAKFRGDINRLRGELDAAKNYFNQSVEILKGLNDRWNLADVHNKLGLVFFQEGKFHRSHEYFQKSLASYTQIGDRIRATDPIFNLIRVKIELSTFKQAEFFFNLLKETSSRVSDPVIDLRTALSEALLLKHKPRIVEKIESQKIFARIAQDEIIDAELTIIAMINLADMLILELNLFQYPSVLEELETLSDRLLEIANNQESYYIQIEALMVQSKINQISGNLEESMQFIEEAEQLAKEYNSQYQLNNIKNEKEEFRLKMKSWKKMSSQSTSIRDKLELAEVQDYIDSLFGPEQ